MGAVDVKKIGAIILAVVVALAALYWYSGRDNGGTSAADRQLLNEIRTEQQHLRAELESVKQGLASSQREIRESRELISQSRYDISDSRSTLDEVGKRLESGNHIFGENRESIQGIRDVIQKARGTSQ